MKKITVFIGSARKKATYYAVCEFEKNIKRYDDIEFEYVFLNEYNLGFCNGCILCFDKGEEYCPLKDDRDLLLEKIEKSDGIIFATPNYAFDVSGRMKNFLDRFAYFYHRPNFFDKTFTAIVTQGFFGGDKIRKYLEKMGENFGFQVVKGGCVSTLDPMTEKQKEKLVSEMEKLAARFYKNLAKKERPVPTLFRLMMFRMSRTHIKSIGNRFRDHNYYKEKGWFESDYYYDTKLSLFKKLVGNFFDFLGRSMQKK